MSSDSLSEAKRWFLQASDELDDAKKLMTMRRYYLALYLSQQSAEKALKAFLYHRGVGPLLTYSVSNLVATASDLDRNFERISPAGRLDDCYIRTRYPNGLPGGIPSRYYTDEAEVRRAIEMSQAVLDLVRDKLSDIL